MKYELHVYFRTGTIAELYCDDLDNAKMVAKQLFRSDSIYKVKVWNFGKAVRNRPSDDLLLELF